MSPKSTTRQHFLRLLSDAEKAVRAEREQVSDDAGLAKLDMFLARLAELRAEVVEDRISPSPRDEVFDLQVLDLWPTNMRLTEALAAVAKYYRRRLE